MKMTPPEKPQKSIQRLMACLALQATAFDVNPEEHLSFIQHGKPQILLLLEGELSVLRARDKLLTTTLYTQHVLGLAETLLPVNGYELRAESRVRMMRIERNSALDIIEKHRLWKEVALLLAYHSGVLFYRNTAVIQRRTYYVIRSHLQELMRLPESVRMKTSILEYIQERTYLSRSSILNVLAVLKSGNYIVFKRGGYLLDIAKLPEHI